MINCWGRCMLVAEALVLFVPCVVFAQARMTAADLQGSVHDDREGVQLLYWYGLGFRSYVVPIDEAPEALRPATEGTGRSSVNDHAQSIHLPSCAREARPRVNARSNF